MVSSSGVVKLLFLVALEVVAVVCAPGVVMVVLEYAANTFVLYH